MKDNFQGPTPYNITNPGGHSGAGGHQSQYSSSAQSPWQSQAQSSKASTQAYDKQYDDRKYIQPDARNPKGQPIRTEPQERTYKEYEKRRGFSPRPSPSERQVSPEPVRRVSPLSRRVSPPGRRVSPPGRRVSPPGRRVSPSGRRVSPSGRRVSPSGRRVSPPGRRVSPPGRRVSPPGRRVSPSGRRVSPSGRHVSPSGRRVSPSGRRVSPSGRHVSPSGRRVSPSGRRVSPSGRRVSPSGRRISPSGRKFSPSVRRISPHTRKFSPPGKRTSPDRRIPGHHSATLLPAPQQPARRDSPHKRLSPVRRLVSPTRRPSPGTRDELQRMPRYSPERHHPEKLSKHGQDKFKQVRPAYEPTVHASNQAMYSGGYRPNNRETVQYSKQGMRQPEPKISPWQREREDPAGPMKKQDEATVDAKRTITPQRKSRSPVRRDRSPLRDRYKRHSPSPRSSHSPRRSWALEKRRSPEIRDAPPPPSWPGQIIRDAEYPRTRPNFPEREAEKPKHVPVWEPRAIDDEPRSRRPDIHEGRRPEIPERRPFIEEKIRPVKELLVRDPVPHPVHREPKFTHREEYDADRRDNYRRRESSVERKPHPHREEYDPVRIARDHEERLQPDEYHRRREPSPRHDSRKELVNSAIDKDFEDYKRAIQKKAEEMRSKRRDDYLEQEGSRSHHSERERDERPQRYEERHRFREEELRAREREERPREDRSRDDRPRDDAPHREYRREDYPKEKQEERVEDTRLKRIIDPSIRIKRDKAIEEISNKILDRHEHYKQLQGEQRNRVLEELKLAIARIVFDMFGDSDVSFIEIIIKYQAKYDLKQEEKILQEVTASLPSPFRVIKRQAPEMSEVPAKTRRSKSPHIVPEHAPRPKLSESRWSMNIVPPELVTLPIFGHPPVLPPPLNPGMVPMMVPAPYIHPYETLPQNPVLIPEQFQPQEPSQQEAQEDGYKVYLCKDDFEQITNRQADSLKDFLISQMLRETELEHGWTPDFTLKGLQNSHRYELITKDASTRDWLVNLDFSGFTEFHVIVYTKEELWYERAAVWLPGHSRSRNIEPLDKLKLQNKRLEGVNITRWKFVKKIVTQKGTRLYVDMPPSSARALEKHKLMLSYELQKVNVFLKALAIDKDAFDAGLKEPTTVDLSVISEAIQNSPMPSLAYDPALIKITLKGCKTLSLVQARKIKEVLIYHLFRYHQQDGTSRTDFVRYGFFPPNCFGLIPQNPETKKWLLSQHLGKVNRQAIVVLGAEDENTRFFRMYVVVPNEYQLKPAIVAERLKQSNQGVKGINFGIWKPIKISPDRKNKVRFQVDVDLESLETLSKMKYQLDYVDLVNVSHTAYFQSDYSYSQLEELIDKCKDEMMDSYDIANMDLDSHSSDDIICLD